MILTDWKMTYCGYKDLMCTAPCTLYSVLLEHDLIDDPFYGLNELELSKLSENDCTFECEFNMDKYTLDSEYIDLCFFGLDTLCRISLNGVIIDNVKNMHRAYRYDIKKYLNVGKNILKLEFSSPVQYFNEMNNKHHLFVNADTLPGASHLRKALYMSGWDWGPTLPDMGIFRPVVLEAYNNDKISDIFVCQHHKDGRVILDIEVETLKSALNDIYVYIDGKEIKLENLKTTVIIENPKLWWVRGYGEQNLYEITVKILSNGEVIDKKTQNIGLRTLTVSTKPDEYGSEFCFVLNGVKIFSMGANYIPQDNLLSRVNSEKTEELIKSAVYANFNTLRIWGGGYWPEDEFYDLCDKYGIMVWQDFMTACASIWLNDSIKQEFIAEAVYNVKRLRHHPSLALLCGNNEIEDQIYKFEAEDAHSHLVRNDYIELYEKIYPEVCSKYAPDVFYWQSSPSSGGGFDNPNCENRGDTHYWAVWHDSVPFTEYRKHNFRFCSEYGFESYPSIKTIKSFCEEKDMNCFSRVMEHHQKCKCGNQKILTYLANNYLYPKSFETLVYASQLLQADAIKYGVEHFRRNRGYCMGSIYWQFNDCWPVASWSSVDSSGRYKALHYAAKKFYAPVAMGLFLEKGSLVINISNEMMSDFEGRISVYHCTSDLKVIKSYNSEVFVDKLSSADVYTLHPEISDEFNEFIYVDLFDKDGNFIMKQTALFVEPKHFNWNKPQIKTDISQSNDGVIICISSDVFTKGVYIDFDGYDCALSDNFFDITDSKQYCIYAKTDRNADELREAIKIMSIYDIGK